MGYRLEDALALLSRAPRTLRELLAGLPDSWLRGDEGPGTWSPIQVVGHLVEAERHLWMGRVQAILTKGKDATFEPFDRSRHLEVHRETPIGELLDLFDAARGQSLAALRALHLTAEHLARRGNHPELGTVTLGQLLATWVAHDLTHLRQIARTMAKQYREAVGPWAQYLRVLHE